MKTCIIDPHVHARGIEYANHRFLNLVIRDCRASGIHAFFEMPNPVPQLVDLNALQAREREIIDKKGHASNDLYHWMHIGLTTDINQVYEAIKIAQTEPGICRGIKMFLTHSTGNMGLLDPSYQKLVWKALVDAQYCGPVLMHCEDETEWHSSYVYSDPVTHSLRQNPESEYIQVERQLSFAADAGFRGIFYVCHVSNPATFSLAKAFRHHDFEIVLEVTWHHMLLNYNDYAIHGNRVKMNPPLRSPQMQALILEAVLNGNASIIGSDHAPHDIKAKDGSTPPSGIPALPFWPKGIEILAGLGIDQARLDKLIALNALRIFNLSIGAPSKDVQYNPDLWDSYGFNPFSRVDH